MSDAFMRRGKLRPRGYTQGELQGKPELETGVMYLQPREFQELWEPSEAGKEAWADSPSEPSEGTSPAHILTADFLASRLCGNTFLAF